MPSEPVWGMIVYNGIRRLRLTGLRMSNRKFTFGILIASVMFGAIAMMPRTGVGADDAAAAAQRARDHWENVILFYGDEETGEWSLRIPDKEVRERAWFEYLELWHFNRNEQRWEQIKISKFQKPIVLPKQKASDQPDDSQTLVEFKEIEPRTAGIWYAKWKADDVECGTLMRVGSGRATNHIRGEAQQGMVQMVVPIDLNKSEQMWVPDPTIYCVNGGPGKPEAPAKKTSPKDADK